MNIDDIIRNKIRLDKELRMALSTMEHKDRIYEIRQAIIENQALCPHFDNNYNWAIIDDTCPYCGRELGKERNY